MASIFDELLGQLNSGGVSAISDSVGATEDQVSKVVMGALPALLGGLAKESSSSGGASALAAALDRDHDGTSLQHSLQRRKCLYPT